MKRIIVLFVFIIFLAATASATPIYLGDPVSDLGTGDTALPSFTDADFNGVGYYIWANDSERTSWSVRWTGRETIEPDVYDWYNWKGSVTYSIDGINDIDLVKWEAGDGTVTLNSIFENVLVFGVAAAGPGWDGFDFTVAGEIGDYLTFSLYSSYFDNGNLDAGIYLGQDYEFVLDNVDSEDYFAGSDGAIRQFEVAAPVPEPGTLLLLGSGLIGLAYLKRRKS